MDANDRANMIYNPNWLGPRVYPNSNLNAIWQQYSHLSGHFLWGQAYSMPETWQLTSRSFALVGKTTYDVNSYSSKKQLDQQINALQAK